MKVYVVIPAYNEQASIHKIVAAVKKHTPHVVVVDDGSRDDTYKAAERAGAIAVRHLVNLGKGAALKTGCDYAYNHDADIMITIDGDLQHDPDDIPRIVKKMEHTQIVFTYRRFTGDMPFVLRAGNWGLRFMTKFLFGMRIYDTQCGYRGFRRDAYGKLRWAASDYSVESEMIARAGRHNIPYTQIPIETVYVDRYKGTTIMDGLKVLISMLWWRLQRR